jgi:hypothetical protein
MFHSEPKAGFNQPFPILLYFIFFAALAALALKDVSDSPGTTLQNEAPCVLKRSRPAMTGIQQQITSFYFVAADHDVAPEKRAPDISKLNGFLIENQFRV